jgi:hypothetical protein
MLVNGDRTAAAIASTWVLFVAAMGSTLDCVKRNIYNLNLLKTLITIILKAIIIFFMKISNILEIPFLTGFCFWNDIIKFNDILLMILNYL